MVGELESKPAVRRGGEFQGRDADSFDAEGGELDRCGAGGVAEDSGGFGKIWRDEAGLAQEPGGGEQWAELSGRDGGG